MRRYPFLILLIVCPAWAGLFEITNRSYGSLPQEVVDPIFDQLEDQVNDNLPDADASTYLKGMANATVTGSGGIGADYSAAYGLALIGASAGLGADLGNNSLSDLTGDNLDTLGGASSQAAVLIGIDPHVFFKVKKKGIFSKTKFYLNFLTYGFNYENFSGSLTSVGLSAQYKLIDAYRVKFGWFRWGGVDATVGIRKSAINVTVTQDVTETVSDTVDMTFAGVANVGADVDVWTIPIEVSTSTRLIYFLSFFGGLAGDINFGKSKSIATLTGPITVSDSGISGEATLDLGQDASPDAFTARAFAGFALDFTAFNINLQYNHSLSNNTIGVKVGMNAYW